MNVSITYCWLTSKKNVQLYWQKRDKTGDFSGVLLRKSSGSQAEGHILIGVERFSI